MYTFQAVSMAKQKKKNKKNTFTKRIYLSNQWGAIFAFEGEQKKNTMNFFKCMCHISK